MKEETALELVRIAAQLVAEAIKANHYKTNTIFTEDLFKTYFKATLDHFLLACPPTDASNL